MRRALLSVLVLALGGIARADDTPKPRLQTKVFAVADLATPIPDFVAALNSKPNSDAKPQPAVAEGGEKLIKLVSSVVKPYSWNTAGGSGSVEFFETGCALVVKNTPEVLREVSDFLEALRRLQDTQICTQVQVISVPVGLREQLKLKVNGETFLTELEHTRLLESLQGNLHANVTQCPKVTTFDGQTANIAAGDTRMFVTGVELAKVKGTNVVVPRQQAVTLGDAFTLCGQTSADGKSVKLQVKFSRTSLVGQVELLPITTQITPVFEGGSQGKPIPFTQFLEAPNLKTEKLDKTLTLPSGGTVVLGGWKEPAKAASPAVLSKIPYISRLYKNTGSTVEREVFVVITTHVIRTEEKELAPMPRVEDAAAPPRVVSAHALKNVAAADAAKAVTEFATQNKLTGVIVVAEPATNTVLVSGNAVAEKRVSKMLTDLDVPPPQVLIQAMVLETSREFLADMGLTRKDGEPLVLTERELAMFTAALRKAKSKGDNIDILSRPQLQMADNQTGHVQVGSQGNVASGLELVQTSAGLTVRKKALTVEQGLKLAITPRLSPKGDAVLLRAEAKVTHLSDSRITIPLTLPPDVTGLKEPVTYQVPAVGAINEQSTQTTVQVPVGRTVILSAGARTEKGSGVVRETLVLLTPHIVKSEVERAAVLAAPQPVQWAVPQLPVPPAVPAPPRVAPLGGVGEFWQFGPSFGPRFVW